MINNKNKGKVLSHQILLFMVLLTFLVVIIALFGSYFFYMFAFNYLPEGNVLSNAETLTVIDWSWFAIASLFSIIIAIFFTIKLSTKILAPLNSVAISLRKIAQGDLTVRASGSKIHLAELNQLVCDFNIMAEKMQRLEDERKSWNAAIAHELRTPVTILRGRLQGLVDEVFEANLSIFINLLHQTEKLTRLIEDLRVIGSGDNGSYLLDIKRISVNEIIDTSIASFEYEFQQKKLIVVKNIKDRIVHCDPIRITQCLTAILDNAIKYSNEGNIIISIRYIETCCYIEVEDSGLGVSVEFQPYLFEPFQRASTSKAAYPQGCGLGLSVVKAIMKAHDGDAYYQLTQSNSSKFILYWPAF